MGLKIKDGHGKGYEARVDRDLRLYTNSVSRSELTQAVIKGDGYNLSTGAITLTSANASAVGYIKNTGDNPLVLEEILIIINPSTGGSGNAIITIVKNPTEGTIITNADDDVTAANRNFASSNNINGLIYKGAEGNTLTDGANFAVSTRDAGFSGVLAFDAAPIVLEKGNSLGIKFQPATSNTSQTIVIAGTGFELKTDI